MKVQDFLALQATVSPQTWVLGMVLWSSGRTAYTTILFPLLLLLLFICLVVLITSVRVSKVPNYGHPPSI